MTCLYTIGGEYNAVNGPKIVIFNVIPGHLKNSHNSDEVYKYLKYELPDEYI